MTLKLRISKSKARRVLILQNYGCRWSGATHDINCLPGSTAWGSCRGCTDSCICCGCFLRPLVSFHSSASSLSDYVPNRGLAALSSERRDLWVATDMDVVPEWVAQPSAHCLLFWEMVNTGNSVAAVSTTIVLCCSLGPFIWAGERSKYFLSRLPSDEKAGLSINLVYLFFMFEYCLGLFHALRYLERLL